MSFFRTKKSLGQHFLVNRGIAKRIADAAAPLKGEQVLEIGPGTGALTAELLAQRAHVVALEADRRAIDTLHELFPSEITRGALTLHHVDVRNVDFADLGFSNGAYKVVANIPYYISGMLFQKLLECTAQPSTIVFLVQKEVAERIARAKKESLLSLSVKAYGSPRFIMTVSRGNFRPVPKVDSAVLAIERISRSNFADLDEAFFFQVLKRGFASRRKQLAGNLSGILPKADVVHILEKEGFPADVRGEDIPIDAWLTIARSMENILSTRGK